jgi:hypothetical protein
MGKILTCNILDSDSIKQLRKEIDNYKRELTGKCEKLVKELAESGIQTAQQNVGGFGKYITFSMEIEPIKSGCSAILYATETGHIVSQWQTKDGVKSADVSPLLMVEFGSGMKAEVPEEMGVEGVGRGTFPGQTHAFDPNGWYWQDLDGVWHHSYGIEPKQPVYKAYTQMESEIIKTAEKIFG